MYMPTLKLLTIQPSARKAWNNHVAEWVACTRCPLGCAATKHVLARGTLPCDILFIGEAPGESEDVIGSPFVGPAGKVLDNLIMDTGPRRGSSLAPLDWTYAISNILACIPRGENGEGFRAPTEEEAKACQPRLLDLLNIASPKGIVLLGQTAKKYFPSVSEGFSVLELHHPSYLLRNGGASPRNVHYARAKLQLRKFIQEVMG
jgi:uracil-DNA glycosylase family 4